MPTVEGFCRDSGTSVRERLDKVRGGIVNVTRRRTRQPRLRQTECRKSHVNLGGRLICKHNARQLYGLPSSGRMRSLRVSPVSLVNFSRTPVHSTLAPFLVYHSSHRLPILGPSCSTSTTASPCPGHRVSKRFNDRFLVRSRVSFQLVSVCFLRHTSFPRGFVLTLPRRQKYVTQIKENLAHGAIYRSIRRP